MHPTQIFSYNSPICIYEVSKSLSCEKPIQQTMRQKEARKIAIVIMNYSIFRLPQQSIIPDTPKNQKNKPTVQDNITSTSSIN